MIDSIQTLCYVALISLTVLSYFVLLPINFNLIVSATSIIFIGSTLSLKDKHENDDKEKEVMTTEDAYMFPVLGSCMLFGLYVLFKIFDPEWVNFIMTLYFAIIGALSLTSAFSPITEYLVFGNKKQWEFKRSFKLPLLGDLTIDFNMSNVITFVFAVVFAASWFQTRHFVLNNIFGIAFSIKGIQSLSLGSYKVGAILLTGLFFYDIFWVFGTDVMVTVATKFDAPIKLLFPREFATATEKAKFSMLGLGDIVIPGIFIALLLRYDAHRAKVTSYGPAFPKPYFYTNLTFYVLGLLATVIVMYAFKAAQPALLYLVPACLGSSLGTGLYLKDLTNLFAYSEEPDSTEKKEDEKPKSPAAKKTE